MAGEKIEFPGGYTRLTNITGNEKVFVGRGSDGAPFWVLLSDIIAGLVTSNSLTLTLNSYQPKIAGKGLSTNDFTDLLLEKLNSLSSGSGSGSALPSDFWITQNVTGTVETVLNPKYLPYGYDLSPTQHELVSDGIGIKGFANIGQGGGSTTTPLAAPVVSLLGNNTSSQIAIQWAAITNATSYDVYQNGVKIGNTANLNYTITGLTASTQYTFTVKSIPTASGYTASAFSNNLTSSTAAAPTLPKLATPVLSFGTSTVNSNIINWGQIGNATSYTLQYNNGSTWTTIYTGALLTFTHSSLIASTNYSYRVLATASGYTDSDYGTGNKTTAAASGGDNLIASVAANWDFQWGPGTSMSGNTMTFNGTGGSYGQAWGEITAKANSVFIIQAQAPAGFGNGGLLGMDETGNDGNNDVLAGFYWSGSNGHGRFVAVSRGTTYDRAERTPGAGITPMARIRGTGTRVYIEESWDSGTTWVDLVPAVTITQPPTAELFPKTFFSEATTIPNIRYSGLTTRGAWPY
jgi:hypothetical protein